jgi:hypothetical protein
MAKQSDTHLPIDGPDPDLASARLAAINQQSTPDPTPPTDHPMVEYARNLLNPINYQSPDAVDRNVAAAPNPTPIWQRGVSEDALHGYQRGGQAGGNEWMNADNVGGPPSRPTGTFSLPLAERPGAEFDPFGRLISPTADARGQQAARDALGGAASWISRQISPPSFGDVAQVTPEMSPQDAAAVRQQNLRSSAFGMVAGLAGPPGSEGELSQVEGGLTGRIGAKPALGVPGEGAGPIQSAAQKSGVAAEDLAAKQLESLRASGASEADIAAFQKTMAPDVPKRVPEIQTAEGAAVDPAQLTRSLQAAAGTEGVPLSQHPIFSDYAIGGASGPKNIALHGGDIGTATRAVMAGDPDALALLGDSLSNRLIQGKIADILRRAVGVPEDVIRRGLGVEIAAGRGAAIDSLPVSDIVRAAEKFPKPPPSIVDANVAVVSDALKTPQPMQTLVDSLRATPGVSEADVADALKSMGLKPDEIKAWIRRESKPVVGGVAQGTKAVEAPTINTPYPSSVQPGVGPTIQHLRPAHPVQADTLFNPAEGMRPNSNLPPNNLPPTGGSGGGSPFGFTPPVGPQQERNLARVIGTAALSLFMDIGRAGALVAHLPLARQAAPLMADAVLRGDPAEIAQAFARTLTGVISESGFQTFRRGAIGSLEQSSGVPGVWSRLILDTHGTLNATEEFTLRSILSTRLGGAAVGGTLGGLQGNTPEEHARNAAIGAGLGLGLQNVNRAYPAMLNSLRYGAAQALVDLRVASGGVGAITAKDANQIIDAVNLMSGRGLLPGGRKAAAALNNIFFGPKYVASEIQLVPSVLRSLGGVVTDAAMRKPLDAIEVFKVRAFAGQVGVAAGILGVLSAFGWHVITDSGSRDYGMAVGPDGSRVDPWGGVGGVARLAINEGSTAADALSGRPARYGANTGADTLTSFLRGKLNPGPATAVANTIFGSLPGGAPLPNIGGALSSGDYGAAASGLPQLAYGNQGIQPLFTEAATGGPPNSPTIGGVKPAQDPRFDGAKMLMAMSGLTIKNTPEQVTYDGLGAAAGESNYQQGTLLDQYQKLAGPDWHKTDPTMAPPATTIGQGANQIKLDQFSAQRWTKALGQQREIELRALMADPQWDSMGATLQRTKWDQTVAHADKVAATNFLANDVIQQTDLKAIVAEAVDGFIKQGASAKDKAYWLALLDRSGKLTPEVSAAIDGLKDVLPNEKAPITVREYIHNAPLVHEYLRHVPFGTDARPIGTPDDWAAVAEATKQKGILADALIRSGTSKLLADQKARVGVLKMITSTVQRNLFLNGTQLENPARRQMAFRYPVLAKFVSAREPNESDQAYQNFGRP